MIKNQMNNIEHKKQIGQNAPIQRRICEKAIQKI